MLTQTDLTSLSASALAREIRARSISCEDAVDACLRRIDAVNPRLNAVIQRRDDAARSEARQADAAIARGEPLGPLHGVPVTIKDAFDLAGVISSGGTLGRATFVPPTDATAVARLRAAGAIPLGKTNVPELSLAYETDNLVYGRTNNPYDPGRSPGGSSGGEAAIIAAGGSTLGVGTDVGGSIRVPAHACGIAGLKPTLGRVPTSGAFPPALGVAGGLYHVGPLARRVEDLTLALSVLAGPDGRDYRAVPAPLGDPRSVTMAGLRVAFYVDNGIASPTAATIAAVEDAARALRDAGALVEAVVPEGIDQAYTLFRDLFAFDDSASVMHLLQMVGTTAVHPLLSGLGEVLHPFATSAAGFGGVLARLDMFRGGLLAFMSAYDAILSPVCAVPAVPHGTSLQPETLPGYSYAMTHNLTGWPAVVVRGGTSPEGLPIGVQLIARPWHEEVALALAEQVERAMGGWPPPTL